MYYSYYASIGRNLRRDGGSTGSPGVHDSPFASSQSGFVDQDPCPVSLPQDLDHLFPQNLAQQFIFLIFLSQDDYPWQDSHSWRQIFLNYSTSDLVNLAAAMRYLPILDALLDRGLLVPVAYQYHGILQYPPAHEVSVRIGEFALRTWGINPESLRLCFAAAGYDPRDRLAAIDRLINNQRIEIVSYWQNFPVRTCPYCELDLPVDTPFRGPGCLVTQLPCELHLAHTTCGLGSSDHLSTG